MALKHVPELCGRSIFCQLQRGALFLRGRVDSYHMKQHAQSAIMNMDGVERVCNELEVVRRTNQ
jgi:osmotically-inducible protein OsmY